MTDVATLHQIAAEQPHTLVNVEAEALLLGALLIESTLFAQIADTITADDFAEGVHARIFAAIARMVGQGKAVTAVLLRPEFENDEGLRELGGVSYLAQLTLDGMQGLLAGREIAEQIHDLAQRRRMIAALDDIRARCHDAASGELPDIAALLDAAPKPAGPLTVFDAFDYKETDIPVRPWLVPGAVLAGYTHMLAAPGGSGKSLFTLQLAIAMADGMHWGGFKSRKRYRSLIINVEDDINEQRRRISGARRVMDCAHDLTGMVHIVESSESIVVARTGERMNSIVATPVVDTLRRYIIDHKIDVIFVDPFAETFEGDENDNSQVKWAMRIWRDEIARATGCAVYLVHHTTKHAQNGAGDANVIRGAGAIVNSTRISATLMPMTPEDANMVGIDPAERHLYVRYDDAKANQSLKTNAARWFRKESVQLDNAAADCPADIVGALVPWIPPDAFDGFSIHQIGAILERVEIGMENGERYSATTKGGTKASGRWIGCLLHDAAGMGEAQARKVISAWLKSGVLIEDEYHCPVHRKKKIGLFAPENSRPGVV